MSGLTIENLRAVFDRFSPENAWKEKQRIDAGVCLYLEVNDLLRKLLPITVRINHLYSYDQYVAIALELWGYKSKKRCKFINIDFDKTDNLWHCRMIAANSQLIPKDEYTDGEDFKSLEDAANDIAKSVIRYIITKGAK